MELLYSYVYFIINYQSHERVYVSFNMISTVKCKRKGTFCLSGYRRKLILGPCTRN